MSSSLGIDYSLWYDIGLELGIEDNKLNTIKANHAGKPFQSSDCMCDVYVHWIRTEGNPTYENLAKVLSAIGMREIALTLCAKYGMLRMIMCAWCFNNIYILAMIANRNNIYTLYFPNVHVPIFIIYVNPQNLLEIFTVV